MRRGSLNAARNPFSTSDASTTRPATVSASDSPRPVWIFKTISHGTVMICAAVAALDPHALAAATLKPYDVIRNVTSIPW